MLRLRLTASAPSARIHAPPGLIPTSRKTVASGTPVHSALLVQPWVCCTVLPHRGFRPLREGIAGALQEVGHGDGGEALQVIHREERGPLDQAMDHQPVLARIDGRNATERDLVEEGIGRERPVQIGQGREADERVGRAFGIGEADHVRLGRGPLAVGRDPTARGAHPHRDVRRQVVSTGGSRHRRGLLGRRHRRFRVESIEQRAGQASATGGQRGPAGEARTGHAGDVLAKSERIHDGTSCVRTVAIPAEGDRERCDDEDVSHETSRFSSCVVEIVIILYQLSFVSIPGRVRPDLRSRFRPDRLHGWGVAPTSLRSRLATIACPPRSQRRLSNPLCSLGVPARLSPTTLPGLRSPLCTGHVLVASIESDIPRLNMRVTRIRI